MATPILGRKAAKVDMLIRQGSTFDETVTYTEEDQVTPIDLTGYTARAKVTKGYGGTEYISLVTGGGITLGAALGTIRIVITSAVTAALTLVQFEEADVVWDFELINGSGAVDRIMQGAVTLDIEATD